jgi:pimeloyl-ACP methyl ester carboxylesterase
VSAAPATMVADVDGAGPAVLLLHGQPGTAADWNAVTPLLVDHFRVVAADRPGYGRTGGSAVGFDGNAAAALALLDRLGVAAALVVAHSWAGGIALRLARLAPDRVAGLVLVAPISPDQPVTALDRLLATRPLSELASIAAGATGRVLLSAPVWRRVEEHLSVPAGTALAALLRQGEPSAVWRSFVREQRAYLEELGSLGDGLETLTCPTVVLVGDADHVVDPGAAGELARRLPAATLHRVPGAGHLLPHDSPTEVTAAVDRVAAAAGLRSPEPYRPDT